MAKQAIDKVTMDMWDAETKTIVQRALELYIKQQERQARVAPTPTIAEAYREQAQIANNIKGQIK